MFKSAGHMDCEYSGPPMMTDLRPCVDPRIISVVLRETMPEEEIDENRVAKQILLDPNFRAEGSIVAFSNGYPVGYCWALQRRMPLENAPDDSDQGYIALLGFKPSGPGKELLLMAEGHLRGAGCNSVWVSPYAPGYFTPGVDVNARRHLCELLLEAGYEVRSRPLAMSLRLGRLKVPSYVRARRGEVEKSFHFSSFQPHLTAPLLRFAESEFAGDWVRFARDGARAILSGADSGRLQIALKDDEVVGFSHYEGGRFGPIGVRNSVKGRGVGSLLMLRTLTSMHEAGMQKAWFLWTDDESASRFYKPWGWQEWRRFAIMSKALTQNQ